MTNPRLRMHSVPFPRVYSPLSSPFPLPPLLPSSSSPPLAMNAWELDLIFNRCSGGHGDATQAHEESDVNDEQGTRERREEGRRQRGEEESGESGERGERGRGERGEGRFICYLQTTPHFNSEESFVLMFSCDFNLVYKIK